MCEECERALNATHWYVARRARVTLGFARDTMSGLYAERIMDHSRRYGVERVFDLINPFLSMNVNDREQILENKYEDWELSPPNYRSDIETKYINGCLIVDPNEICAMEYIRKEIDTPRENFDYNSVWEILEEAVFGYFKLDWESASRYVVDQIV